MSKKKNLSVPDKHRVRVAKQTLRLNDVGVSVLGGMTKEEAREFLRAIGYTPAQIAALEEVVS